jgi:uncharacterized heparinase superfamily protein
MTLSQYYQTLRALRLKQIRWRIQYAISRKLHLRHHVSPPMDLSYRMPIKRRVAFLWPPVGSRTDLQNLTFDYLNSVITYRGTIDWNASGQQKLWGYILHYFDFLSIAEPFLGMRLILDWIERCRDGIGWESAPLSCRVINWIKFASDHLSHERDREFLHALADSIFVQADWLGKYLERDVDGNHLLRNAVALIFAGNFLNNERRTREGKNLLLRMVEEQILPDGAHYERSPMYHSMVLMDLLDVVNLDLGDEPFHRKLVLAATPALKFLQGVTHPDGQISLFNDSAFGFAPRPESILSYAAAVMEQVPDSVPSDAPVAFSDSGYYLLPANDWRMVVDAGEIGPQHQPAHSHCDLLSFELSLGRSRVIVDSGNYDYSDSDMRVYCRSTRAHNTVLVDGIDQSDMWKIFRVGRRARPELIAWKPGSEVTLLHIAHTGYLQTIGVKHERIIAAFSHGFYLIVDRFSGKGCHQIQSFIHFHPDCSVKSEDNIITMNFDGKQANVLVFPFPGSLKIGDGWYCPEMGSRFQQKVLVLESLAHLPLTIAYCVGNLPQENMHLDSEKLILSFGNHAYSLGSTNTLCVSL